MKDDEFIVTISCLNEILLLAFQTIFRPVDWTLNEFFIVYVWD